MGNKTTFAAQAEAYLTWLETRNDPAKPTTVATVRSLLSCHVMPIIGQQPLAGIDNESMRLLVAEIVQRKKLSPNSIPLVVKFTKRVIANAVDNRGNRLYPRTWNREFIGVPKMVKRKKPTVTSDQIEAALHAARPILRELIATLAASGLRKGEALALNVKDFDLRIGFLHVRGTRSYFGETAPKTRDGERQVDLHPEIVAILQRLVGTRTSGRLFEITIDEMRRGFERLDLKPHSLRRYRVTWLRRHKCDEDILRLWIGHGTRPETQTDHYSFLCDDIELRQRLVREVGLGFKLPQIAAPVTAAPVQGKEAAQASA